LALAAAMLAGGAGAAVAQAEAAQTAASDNKAGFIAAAAALQAALGPPGGGKTDMPGEDDPLTRRFLTEQAALLRTLGTPAAPAADFAEFGDVCGAAARVQSTYQMAGLANHVSQGMSEAEAVQAMSGVAADNTGRWADIIVPTMLFNQHCAAAYMPAAEAGFGALSQDPDRLAYLLRVRHGLAGVLQGVLGLMADPQMPPKVRLVMLSQVEIDWDRLIAAMAPADRALTADAVTEAAAAAPALRPRLQALQARLARAGCGAVCSA